MSSQNKIPLAIILGGAIIAVAVYVSVSKQNDVLAAHTNVAAIPPVTTTDHIFGKPTAPIQIVEYSDLECAHCKDFHATLTQVLRDYGGSGKIAWVYRHLPITTQHANALIDAEASECVASVGGNDVFWKFIDSLFEKQPVDPIKLTEFVKRAGADVSAYSSCMQQQKATIDANITAEREGAIKAGATGTPFTVLLIQGSAPVVLDGAWGYADFRDQIDIALDKIK